MLGASHSASGALALGVPTQRSIYYIKRRQSVEIDFVKSLGTPGANAPSSGMPTADAPGSGMPTADAPGSGTTTAVAAYNKRDRSRPVRPESRGHGFANWRRLFSATPRENYTNRGKGQKCHFPAWFKTWRVGVLCSGVLWSRARSKRLGQPLTWCAALCYPLLNHAHFPHPQAATRSNATSQP